MDVLPDGVVNQIAAVRQLSADGDPRLPAKPHQRFHANRPQIPGDDEIVVLRRGGCVIQMRPDGVKCGGCHGCAHVACVGDAKVGDRADGGGLDGDDVRGSGDQCRAGAGDRPLGGGGALSAVAQGEAVLPL